MIRENKIQHLKKCVLVFFIIFILLFCIKQVETNTLLGAIGSSSLAASLFILLVFPNTVPAKPKNMLGGYILGIGFGIFFYYLNLHLTEVNYHLFAKYSSELTCAMAVFATMFAMILFGLEHPPASGLSLGLVIDDWESGILIVILSAIIIMTVVKLIRDKMNIPDKLN